jgi:GT2 family glycosyltransferase
MKLSVVIPCRNEELFIEECINAIYSNNLSSDIQLTVIVVDGMSDDTTRDKIKELQSTYTDLFIVDNVEKLTPFAFNLGIKFQYSDYFQIVGARQILSKNYLMSALNVLKNDSEIWCVGGSVENVYVNKTGEIISNAMSTTFGMGLGNFRTLEKSGYTDTVGTPMYPKWVFEKIGYFDEQLIRNQDDDYNFRVTKAGGKIWFDHSISLKYYVRGNYKGLFKQFFQYGYWKVFVNKKHASVTTLRQLVPPIFVVYLFLTPFILFINITLFFLAVSGLFFYGFLAIYFALKKATNLKEFLGIFKTFPILHISYGLGYLLGIFHFLILNKKPSDKQKSLSR